MLSTSSQTPSKVLLVDDDADSLYLLEQILEKFVCTLFSADEGLRALTLSQTLCPDLILLDIWLPGLSGIEITKTLRQNPETRNIPIIAVTALATDKDRESILASGCTQYISKPYDIEKMEALLSLYLSPRF